MPFSRPAARALLACLPLLPVSAFAAPKAARLVPAKHKAAPRTTSAVRPAPKKAASAAPVPSAAKPAAIVKVADAPAALLPPVPNAVSSAPAAAPFLDANGIAYTGIVFDLRGEQDITRSMSPAVCGPAPDFALLYPDRTHVPTPDEVQDESIVRYYVTEDAEHAGVCGAKPLVIVPTAVCGPARDSIVLSAADVARMQQADAALHFSHTWKVGFLLPAGH